MYATIEAAAQGPLSVQWMCQAAGMSRAGFYRDWQERKPQEAELAIRDAVQKVALRYRRYGYRRVSQLVQRSGIAVGEWVVRRILRTDNLLAVRKRKFVVTTDSAHPFTVYPNLARYVRVNAINQLWVADITYVKLGREFVYLAVILDTYSRRVVGWSLDRNLQTRLPLTALNRAIANRQPGPNLVHHSDRGSQYASAEYVQRLEEAQMLISMSRPARPWENAYCESFLRTLKEEEINCRAYATLEILEQNIEDFIERFYNGERLHSALNYRSPEEFENDAAQQPLSLPVALSFPRHREIYPDGQDLPIQENGGAVLL
jgi:putative transposase